MRKKFWHLYVWACCAGPDWLTVTRFLQDMPNDLASPHVDGRHRFTPPSQESIGKIVLVASYLRAAAGEMTPLFKNFVRVFSFRSFQGRFRRADSEYLIRFFLIDFVDLFEGFNIFGNF